MNVRYQVFVSSTYKDLIEERQIVTKTLLKMDCFPAGMELFPAIDEEQFEYIKEIIDNSDYYVILLGGKYGTIAPDGLSYTEKEYDYARTQGKKIIALIQNDPKFLEIDEIIISKFNLFKSKVKKEKLVQFWDEAHELSGLLSISLDKTIKRYPTDGWLRCNPSKCSYRLPFAQINSEISKLDVEIKSIHIMSSGSSSYISIVRSLLHRNKLKHGNVDVYIYFRCGNNNERLNSIKTQYDIWWKKLKSNFPNLNILFSYISDFEVSFRGVVVNKEIGFIGFYNRINNDTEGMENDIIVADCKTDVGQYLISCFLKSFVGKKTLPSMSECIDDMLKNA